MLPSRLPGSVGTALVDSIAINFLPTRPLTLETTTELTVAGLMPLAGTDAPGTAPALAVAPVGSDLDILTTAGPSTTGHRSCGGAFGDFPARLYSLSIPADGGYTVSLDWEGGAEDLGIYPLRDRWHDRGRQRRRMPAAVGPILRRPRSTFTAGTYLLAIVNFSADESAELLDSVHH